MAKGPVRPVFETGKPLQAGLALRLPEGGRARLAEPFGEVFDGAELVRRVQGAGAIAAVGDVTAGVAVRERLETRFIVVDFKTKRGPAAKDEAVRAFGKTVEKVSCPPGHMTADLYNAVLRAARRRSTTRIEVDGEEDLAVMPAIMHLAPPATVIYGLPNRGVTLVKVDDESRRVAREFLETFEVVSA